jgi:hypothetical protein
MKRHHLVIGAALFAVLAFTIYVVTSRLSTNPPVRVAVAQHSAPPPDDRAASQPAPSTLSTAGHHRPPSGSAPLHSADDAQAQKPAQPSEHPSGSAVEKPEASDSKTDPPPAAELLRSWVEGPPPADDDGSQPFRSAPTLHQDLTKQERDPNWSESAEAQIRAYLTYMIKDNWIEIISIQCGSSLCEIQSAVRSPDTAPQDVADWQEIFFSMPQQWWWATYGFDDPTIDMKTTLDNRILFSAFIKRV